MDELVLRADLDENTTVYVSPIGPDTYREQIEDNALGDETGYFVLRSRRMGLKVSLDILAKAASFDAAGDLFDLIVAGRRRSVI